MAQTLLLQMHVDDRLTADAAEHPAPSGLTAAESVHVPPGLAASPEAYDAWFRASVQQALDDTRPPVSHRQVMDEAQAVIDGKRHAYPPA